MKRLGKNRVLSFDGNIQTISERIQENAVDRRRILSALGSPKRRNLAGVPNFNTKCQCNCHNATSVQNLNESDHQSNPESEVAKNHENKISNLRLSVASLKSDKHELTKLTLEQKMKISRLEVENKRLQENVNLKSRLIQKLVELSSADGNSPGKSSPPRSPKKDNQLFNTLREKYIYQLEQVQLSHEAKVGQVRDSMAEEIEYFHNLVAEMALTMSQIQQNCTQKVKDLIDVVCEKEAEIQEQKDAIDDLSKVQGSDADEQVSYFRTEGNALKMMNSKLEKKVQELEESNKKLTVSIMQEKSNKVLQSSNNKDLMKHIESYQNKLIKVENELSLVKKKYIKVSSAMKYLGLTVDDLRQASEQASLSYTINVTSDGSSPGASSDE